MHVEGQFTDNIHTLRGTIEHERVDQVLHEIKRGVRIEFALPVWSDTLGLSGRCDVVEFHPDGTIYPVEYKHGKRKRWLNDDIQLAAQAICLQEMTGVPTPAGAIFHIQSKRRRDVAVTATLIEQVEDIASKVRALLAQPNLPPPTDEARRCSGCSMTEICAPDFARAQQRIRNLNRSLYVVEDESLP